MSWVNSKHEEEFREWKKTIFVNCNDWVVVDEGFAYCKNEEGGMYCSFMTCPLRKN